MTRRVAAEAGEGRVAEVISSGLGLGLVLGLGSANPHPHPHPHPNPNPNLAEVISSVARSGTGHAFERGGLHKISEHFRAALEALLSPPPTGRAHSHAILVEDDLLLSNPNPSPSLGPNPHPNPSPSPYPNQDDLLLSPDALLLFWSSAWLLREDPSLWCAAVPTPMPTCMHMHMPMPMPA